MPIDNRAPESKEEQTDNENQATNPESADSGTESAELTPEQMATQKFDEIIDKIFKLEGSGDIKLKKEDKTHGMLNMTEDEITKKISIEWYPKKGDATFYTLSKDKRKGWNYHLASGTISVEFTTDTGIESTTDTGIESINRVYHHLHDVDNLTPEELLNDILPNFEKRLNEAEAQKKQDRRDVLDNASKYAQKQDQQEADDLLNNLG